MNDVDWDRAYRAHATAFFAVAKTQAGSGDIADLPAWFLTEVHVSKTWKDKDVVTVTFSVYWNPFLEPNECFEMAHGRRHRVIKNPETGKRTHIIAQYGAWEFNRIDLFELDVDLSKNHVRVNRLTDLRVVNPEVLDLDYIHNLVKPEEYRAKCFTHILETPTVEYPDFLNKR